METLEITFGPKFDWFDVLDQLKNGAQLSFEDKLILREKAGQWTTCACGQLCKLLPRNANNAPSDLILNQLGVTFSEYISNRNWTKAMYILERIEERSTTLLQRMGIRVVLVKHPRSFKLASKPDAPKKVEVKPFASQMTGGHVSCGFQRQ